MKEYITKVDKFKTKGIFNKKTEHRGIKTRDQNDFFDDDKVNIVHKYWEKGLSHQISSLPEFSDMIRELKMVIPKFLNQD